MFIEDGSLIKAPNPFILSFNDLTETLIAIVNFKPVSVISTLKEL